MLSKFRPSVDCVWYICFWNTICCLSNFRTCTSLLIHSILSNDFSVPTAITHGFIKLSKSWELVGQVFQIIFPKFSCLQLCFRLILSSLGVCDSIRNHFGREQCPMCISGMESRSWQIGKKKKWRMPMVRVTTFVREPVAQTAHLRYNNNFFLH